MGGSDVAVLTRSVYEAMIAHAQAGYPNEACGILAAKSGEEACGVFYPMRNLDESSISYFMDPKEQLGVFKRMRQEGLEMRGIFHSHVASEAYPSQKDVRLAYYPEVSYLIVSLSDRQRPVLRSYRIVEEAVSEQELRVV
ncbi:MAG: CysO-cysteine peptidase [Candidatus Omnitrophica bacterium]|nr:CysO-cysteine peptidase [Candidatus Omnitrophota bacterium]